MAGAAADAGELDEQHAAAQVAERYGRRIGVDERPVGRLPAHDVVGLLGLVPQLALAQHVAVGVIRFQPERCLRLVVDAHVEDESTVIWCVCSRRSLRGIRSLSKTIS